MMLFVILAPLALAAVALAVPSNRRRPVVLVVGALLHAGGVAALFVSPAPAAPAAWLAFDPIAKITLLTTTILFVASAVYAQGYLAQRADRDNRVFVGGLLGLLGTMTTVALSQHLGLTWVAMEASTLATAPLIYFNHNARSLEATWKYLLI
ncbi:MAG TPA: hydrogenase, partial [Anaeromyxobacter sp.]